MIRLILSLVLIPIFANAQGPSWFPRTACRQAWTRLIPTNAHKFKPGEPYKDYLKRTDRKNCYKDWTVLVYMAADNDLMPYAMLDLLEMEASFDSSHMAASTLRTDLLLQVDTNKNDGLHRLHMFQAAQNHSRLSVDEARKLNLNDIESPEVMTKREASGAQSSLKAEGEFLDFLAWGVREYPAKHYMVVLWGHGQGWSAKGVVSEGDFRNRSFGGAAFDESNATFLTTLSIRKALDKVVVDTLEGKRIDIYASDACLMQMIEVANEISKSARYVVGSTQVQNYLGLPYRRIMYELNSGRFNGARRQTGSDDEAWLLAQIIPAELHASVRGNGLQFLSSSDAAKKITMSSMSTDALVYELVPAMQRLAKELQNYIVVDSGRSVTLRKLIGTIPTFMGGAQELGVMLGYLESSVRQDLSKSPANRLSAETLIKSIADAKSALLKTVVANAYGTDYLVNQNHLLGFRSVSIWMPTSEREYQARIKDFTQSAFYTNSDWAKFLAKLYP